MSEKVWIGSIFLKNEGGFDIVMRALNHYNRRLHRIAESPEISDAGAMFGSILQSESMKNSAKLKPIAERLRAGLSDESKMHEVENDLEIIEKALICYKSDSQKALDKSHDYYVKLAENNSDFQSDLPKIDETIKKLKQYS